MQNCAWVLGYTASMAPRKAGKAVAAGDKDISNARFFSSVRSTLSQNFAPSFCLIQRLKQLLVALQVDAQGQVDRLVPAAA